MTKKRQKQFNPVGKVTHRPVKVSTFDGKRRSSKRQIRETADRSIRALFARYLGPVLTGTVRDAKRV